MPLAAILLVWTLFEIRLYKGDVYLSYLDVLQVYFGKSLSRFCVVVDKHNQRGVEKDVTKQNRTANKTASQPSLTDNLAPLKDLVQALDSPTWLTRQSCPVESALVPMEGRAKDHLGPLFSDKQIPSRALACRDSTMLSLDWWINISFHQ